MLKKRLKNGTLQPLSKQQSELKLFRTMTTFLKNSALFLAVLFVSTLAAQTPDEGLSAMQFEEWDKAIAHYTKLTQADATNQDAWLTLGNAYLAKGDKVKAKEAWDAAFTAKSDAPMAYTANGRNLMIQDKQTEADAQFAKAAKNGKKDVASLRQIGESFLFYTPAGSKRPNFVRAEEKLKAAIEVNSKDFLSLMALGYTYKEMSNGGLAAQQYEYAAQLQPKNPLPMYMLAKVYKTAKIDQKFLENIDKTLVVLPSYTPALRAKAEHFYFGREWENALAAYKELITKGDAVTIDDEMLFANTQFINKDYQGCITTVEKIIQKDGSKNYLRRLLGYCYYETGDYTKGLAIMNEYFKVVTPEKILASDYQYLGRLQVKTKSDTLQAIGNFGKAIGMDSSMWPLYKEMAELNYATRDYCGAALNFQRHIDSLPKPDATQYYYLGTSHYYCRNDSMNYQKALASFSKVAEIVPTATLGHFWSGKSAAQLDPDVEANPDLLPEFGLALPYFEKYIEIASADIDKNKKDLVTAYGYNVFTYYAHNQQAKYDAAVVKLLEIDPTNETALGLQQNVKDNNGMIPPQTNTPTPVKGSNK